MTKDIVASGVALLAMTAAALAQETGSPTVTVPWGNYVAAGIDVLLPTLLTALTGVATYVVGAYVPPWMKAIAGDAAQRRVNQVLEKAVLSAVAQTKGAVLGKRLTIPVGYEVLAKAAQYAIDQAPKLMGEATHDSTENLSKMILARMEQWGIAPEKMDPAKVVVKAKDKDFSFGDAISKGLGGK